MTLIPIHHATRLRTPAAAEALFRALGDRRISARGFHTADPGRLERVIAAVTPRRDSTVSFAGGTLGVEAIATLAALVASGGFGYLDVRTTSANLRVWPQRYSWVHAQLPADGLAGLSAVLGAPLVAGEQRIGDAKLVIGAGPGYPVDLDTPSWSTALRAFQVLTSEQVSMGFVTGLSVAGRPLFLRFVRALETTCHATLEIDLTRARELAELFAGEPLEWHGAVIVRFPEGEIYGYLMTPKVGERHVAQWQRRVDRALKKAGIPSMPGA